MSPTFANQALTLLAVSVGAGIGAQLRYGLDMLFTTRPQPNTARATLIANISGSALIGVMVAVLNQMHLTGAPPWWAQVLTAGLAGGLTTFSTFTAQVIGRAKENLRAGILLAGAHAAFGLAAALGAWWVTWKILA